MTFVDPRPEYQDILYTPLACARCGLISRHNHRCVTCYGLIYDNRARRHRNDRGQFAALPITWQHTHGFLMHGAVQVPVVIEMGA